MPQTIRLAGSRFRIPQVVVTLAWEGLTESRIARQYSGALSAAVQETLGRGEFAARRGEAAWAGAGSTRVLVVGVGLETEINLDALRHAAAVATRRLQSAKVTRVQWQLPEDLPGAMADGDVGQMLGEGMTLARFNFDHFKGAATGAGEGTRSDAWQVAVDSRLRDGFAWGQKLAASANLARELAATPPNVAAPAYLVQACRTMARQVGLSCEVIDARRAEALGMGGLTAVGRAGSTPPALIVLKHIPKGAAAKQSPVLLVGKAVTFDTGGYSIKPAQDMDRMKYDKCGGMAVIGALHAAATLNLPVPVVGLIPAAENLIAQNAYRPADILRFHNGVTCEVTNTDAEGRLILADALAYGTSTCKPQAVIDLATLTGGVIVALGSYCAGCFCGDSELRSRLFDAADRSGERLWHLPLWNEHRELMKGLHADLVNSAPVREAHPIQGAAFLSFFIMPDGPTKMPTLPWAHLDIAGVSDQKSTGNGASAGASLYGKGPTGYGVRLLVEMLRDWKTMG